MHPEAGVVEVAIGVLTGRVVSQSAESWVLCIDPFLWLG
jgi:hypothetical protein